MALSNPLPINKYPEESKVYTTRATLNLQPAKRTTSLGRQDMENLIFEWHTNVTTPPNTPVSPPLQQKTSQSTNQATRYPVKEPSRDLNLPAFTYNESDDLPTQLDKFMSCERYHSQYQQALGRTTTL